MQNLTCNNCNWVSFGMPLARCQEAVEQFNAYFATLSKEKQDKYYGGKGSSLDDYTHCHRCGGPHTNFRPSSEAELAKIFGSTINPICVD